MWLEENTAFHFLYFLFKGNFKTQPVVVDYTLIVFDERATIWLLRAWPLACACAFAAFTCVYDTAMVYASLRANNATYAHAQGSDRTR